jgi:hypothetical protein
MLMIVSSAKLLRLVAGTTSFISNEYHFVYATANNKTTTTSSPIGSKTFLTVTTKVNGSTKKSSDVTITVYGDSASPKPFSGSSSGTSVKLNSDKYKVTAARSSGYTTKYSSSFSKTTIVGL